MKRLLILILVFFVAVIMGCNSVNDHAYISEDVRNITVPQISEDSSSYFSEKEQEDLRSPFLFKYIGYLDEAYDYLGREYYVDKDYDQDGLIDRIYQEYDQNNTIYRVEFGNGKILKIPDTHDGGSPDVQMGDLNGDGIDEVLFTIWSDGTNPLAFGNMWLFEYKEDIDRYEEVPINALIDCGDGERRLAVTYGLRQGNTIPFTVECNGFQAEQRFEEDDPELLSGDEAYTYDCAIYTANLAEYQGQKVVRCEIELFYNTGYCLSFDLIYDNDDYRIVNMKYPINPTY
ncbi:MAG: VCBS repeat-containing protein [Lachnospiraceae bacterium]|nr:VCBS repeat-containing protein [Lachnospiraceae bacterium]